MFKLFASLCNSTGALYKANTESLLRLLEYVIDYNFNHKPNRKFALVSVKVDGEDLLSNGKRTAKPNGFCFNGNHTSLYLGKEGGKHKKCVSVFIHCWELGIFFPVLC